MTLLEQANAMYHGRLIHRKRDTVPNARLAVDLGLCGEFQGVELCHLLGLYAYGAKGHTCIKKMTEHINSLV